MTIIIHALIKTIKKQNKNKTKQNKSLLTFMHTSYSMLELDTIDYAQRYLKTVRLHLDLFYYERFAIRRS